MATEIWQLSESELLAAAADVSHQIQLLEARRIALVAEIDTRVSREKLGFPGPAGWLTSTTLLTPSKATKIVALARGLKSFPDIADAVTAGVVSVDNAALILAFAEKPPKNLPAAGCDVARTAMIKAATGPEANSDRIREAITRLKDTYGGDTPPADDTDRNELFAAKTLNGRLHLRGDFDAIIGEKLLSALSPLSAPTPAVDGTQDERSPAKRRADGFERILDDYLALTNRPTEGGERPHLNLHIDLRDLTLLRNNATDTDSDATDTDDDHGARTDSDIADDENTRAATDPGSEGDCGTGSGPVADRGAYRDLFGDGTSVGWLPWMGPLSRNTSRRLACDCVLTTIVMDENGAPIDLGRTARTVNAKLKRALIARDHTCAFPNCGKPAAWTEAHHVWHWGDGGPTDLDNLVLLCGFHHRLMHNSAWEVIIGADRHPWFIPPVTVDPSRQPRQSQARAGPHVA